MKMPTIFVAHGAPPLLDEPRWVEELKTWADGMPVPNAVLMLSAHWEERPITLGTTTTVPLVYDFYGFPQRYYQQRYPAPGAPGLAERVHKTLGSNQPVMDEPNRGLDHGAYVPLVAMYPQADVRTLQASLPSMEPAELFALGRKLAAAGRGCADRRQRVSHPQPARDGLQPRCADAGVGVGVRWVGKDALERKDVDALLGYRRRAPGVRLACRHRSISSPFWSRSAPRLRIQPPRCNFRSRASGVDRRHDGRCNLG